MKNIETCMKSESNTENEFVNFSMASSLNHCTRIVNENVDRETDERIGYIITYAILMAVTIYVYIHRTFAFFSMCLKASTTLHDKLFRGITRATMFFFNNNSSGRILNRFSRDINIVDVSLPLALIECISVS